MKYIIIFYILLSIIIVFSLIYIKINHDTCKCYQDVKNKYKNIKSKYTIEKIKEENFVDKNILQIYFQGREKVPGYVFKNMEERNEKLGWKYHFYDEEMIKDYLLINYGKEYVDKLNSFEKYAHKADLFRLCWLYHNGGIYLDIDIELLVNADKLLKDSLDNFTLSHTVIKRNNYETFISKIFVLNHKSLLNGLIIVNKGNELLKKCIEKIMMIKREDLNNNYQEILFLMQDTLGEDFKYSFEERYTFFENGSKFYNKKGEHIANEKYKNYKEGRFK